MKERIVAFKEKYLKIQIIICFLLVIGSIVLLKHNIALSRSNYYNEKNPIKESTESNMSSRNDSIVENKKTALIYEDSYGMLEILTSMIKNKIDCDIYNVNTLKDINLNQYDLVLLGNRVEDNQFSKKMINFLNEHDLNGLEVSTYWIGAMDNALFENNSLEYLKNAKVLPGFGINSDEISETEEVNYLMDGWLTTVLTTS